MGEDELRCVLPTLPDLQELGLYQVCEFRAGLSHYVRFPGNALPSLAQLRCLRMDAARVSDVDKLSCLSALRVLNMHNVMQGVVNNRQFLRLASGWTLPASLLDVCLSADGSCVVLLDPSVLSNAANLTRLQLANTTCECPAGVCDGGSLLSAVANMDQLVVLSLTNLHVQSCPPASPVYQALAHSSRLRRLVLNGEDNILSQDAWLHVLPPGRVLPSLQHLGVRGLQALSGEVVSRVVSCAPEVKELQLVLDSLDISLLHPLTALTGLTLSVLSEVAGVEAAAQAIAALSALRALHLVVWTVALDEDVVPGLPSTSTLLPLTSLTQLTSLRICGVLSWSAQYEVGVGVEGWRGWVCGWVE